MEIEASKITIQKGTLTLSELINEIKKTELFGFSSNELKTEFYKRFKNRLYQYCQRICFRNRFDNSVVKEICQITFIKALDKIGNFEFEPTVSDEKLKNSVSAYLNKTAFNAFVDYLSVQNKISEIDETFEEQESDYQRPDEFEFNHDENTSVRLQEVFDDLNYKEKVIIYFCIQHNCLSNNNHLPDKSILEICQKLNINKGNIRVIKLRALNKFRAKFLA